MSCKRTQLQHGSCSLTQPFHVRRPQQQEPTLAAVLADARDAIGEGAGGAALAAELAAIRPRVDALDAGEAHAAHMATGSLLASRGAYAEAVRSFEAALALRWTARALFHLGNAQFALRLYGSAEGSYADALAVSYLHCLGTLGGTLASN